MVLCVTDDFTTVSNADSTACNVAVGGITLGMCVCTVVKVEGSASQVSKTMCSGIGGTGHDPGACCRADMTDTHVMMWGRTLDGINAVDGWRLRIACDTDCMAEGQNCYGEWTQGSTERARNTIAGFISFSADIVKPFSAICATPPAITLVRQVLIVACHTSNSGRCTFFHDEIKYGTGICVK